VGRSRSRIALDGTDLGTDLGTDDAYLKGITLSHLRCGPVTGYASSNPSNPSNPSAGPSSQANLSGGLFSVTSMDNSDALPLKQVDMGSGEWEETFRPIKNHLDDNANADGRAFETYGAEVEFVRSHDVHNIWTLVEGDNDSSWVTEGFRLVNRESYFITEVPWEEGTVYNVCWWEGNSVKDDCVECGEMFDESIGLVNVNGEGICSTCRVELKLD
jgi:hypothetical protein